MALATATLRTTFTPPLSVSTDDLLSGGGGGGGASSGGAPAGGSAKPLWLRLLRPAWSIETPLGVKTSAPAGDPGDAWTWVLPLAGAVLVAVLGFAVYGVVSLARRGRR